MAMVMVMGMGKGLAMGMGRGLALGREKMDLVNSGPVQVLAMGWVMEMD